VHLAKLRAKRSADSAAMANEDRPAKKVKLENPPVAVKPEPDSGNGSASWDDAIVVD
jgi:hypothetical protein